jgi:hypothetical protein
LRRIVLRGTRRHLAAVVAGRCPERQGLPRAGATGDCICVTDRFEPAEAAAACGDAGVCLRFRRQTSGPAGDVVVFPGLGRLITLPLGCEITVDLGPLDPGEYVFSTWDGGSNGTLVVTDERATR